MSIEPVTGFRRTVRIPYSKHPVARLYRGWRRVAGEVEDVADVVLLPLAGLALSLYLLGIPGTSDAVAAACSVACLP